MLQRMPLTLNKVEGLPWRRSFRGADRVCVGADGGCPMLMTIDFVSIILKKFIEQLLAERELAYT